VRKKNAGLITDVAFSQAMVDFRAEVISAVDFQLVVTGTGLVLASPLFIERHSLNATDALILRSVLDIAMTPRAGGNDVVLLTTDQRLLNAARLEGLQTFNPETDTQAQLAVLL